MRVGWALLMRIELLPDLNYCAPCFSASWPGMAELALQTGILCREAQDEVTETHPWRASSQASSGF